MKTFKDNCDRTWTLSLTVQSLKRVKALLPGIDLLALDQGDPPLAVRLSTDVILLCDVLFALLKPDADSQGISDEDFARGLGGDGLALAADAFAEEMRDFFQKLGRTDLARVIATQKALVQKVTQRQETEIGNIDLDALIEKTRQELQASRTTSGRPSTSSPESSASIPDPSLSAS